MCCRKASGGTSKHCSGALQDALWYPKRLQSWLVLQVDFSMGRKNPMDVVKFFDEWEDKTAFLGSSRPDNSLIPRYFQASRHFDCDDWLPLRT